MQNLQFGKPNGNNVLPFDRPKLHRNYRYQCWVRANGNDHKKKTIRDNHRTHDLSMPVEAYLSVSRIARFVKEHKLKHILCYFYSNLLTYLAYCCRRQCLTG